MSDGDPVLLTVTRGELIESQHRGAFVLLDGAKSRAAGDVARPIYPRSSLKPLQTVAMLGCGFDGPSESVAIATASHNGEPMHLAQSRAVLAAAGLDESALQCPRDLPSDRDSMLRYVADGGQTARICHNCSGKHSAMVATCVAARWDVGAYLDPDHPLQREIASTIEQLAASSIESSSVDGCGAPAHTLPLLGLARAFAALANADPDSSEGRVAAAMRAHPLLLGGTGRAVSELTAEVPGLVCKDGAEGVWAAALPDGRAFAVKVADGASRALPPLLAAVLAHWGCNGEAVRRWSAVPTLGGGKPVGAITSSTQLRELLDL